MFYAALQSCREVLQSGWERSEWRARSQCPVHVHRNHNLRGLIGRRMSQAASASRKNTEAYRPIHMHASKLTQLVNKLVTQMTSGLQ